MDTPNLWFLQNYKIHNFCKCGTQKKLESRRKDLYSNVFMKVRFSFSRYCNRCLLWSLTVSDQAGQTPAERDAVGLRPHRVYARHGGRHSWFQVQRPTDQRRGKDPCDHASNQKGKSHGALCISLWVTMTGLSPKCIYRSDCLPAVFSSGHMFRNYVDSI